MRNIGGNLPVSCIAGRIENPNESRVPGTSSEVSEVISQTSASDLPMPSHLNNAEKSARHRILGDSFHTDLKLPQVTPHQLEEVINDALKNNPGDALDLSAQLAEKGYSKNIDGIHFSSKDSPILRGMKLQGLTFSKCEFDWNHLSEAKILNCNFNACVLKNVSFMNSLMRNCKFENCSFKESMFVNCNIADTKFHDSTFVNSSFEDAKIARTSFKKVQMPGTHFLDASVSESTIKESDLKDTVFFGRKDDFSIDDASRRTAKLTKPTTATLVFPEIRGISVPLVGEKISGVAHTIPVRIAKQTPLVRKEDVDQEVDGLLDSLDTLTHLENSEKSSSLDQELPIAQRLLKTIRENQDAYPCASRIVAKAEFIAKHVDSVVLPGGEDVSPRLYGEEQSPDTKWHGDYRRSLMELGLIHQCFNKGIPLMAICRGFQITSVYFGAKLHQHVGSGQVGVQILGKKEPSDMEEASSYSGIYGDVVSGIRAAVYHHQAVPVNADLKHIGPSLTHTVTDPDHGEKWNVIMAVEQNSGAPILGVQFHPEFFKDNPSIQASNAELTNDELIQIARNYERPGRNARGLQDPSDMVESGILEHMSSDNDDIWEILADAANTYRNKSEITEEVLLQQKENLREPN